MQGKKPLSHHRMSASVDPTSKNAPNRLWTDQREGAGDERGNDLDHATKDPVEQPHPTPTPASSGTLTETVHADWDAVREMFLVAAESPIISERFGTCNTVAVLRARSLPDDPLVVDGRGRLEIDTASANEATVEIELDDFDVGLLAQGTIRLAMSIAMGRATYRGPVREFLRVLPTVLAINCPPPEVGQAHDDE